jgi:hypothetical protein
MEVETARIQPPLAPCVLQQEIGKGCGLHACQNNDVRAGIVQVRYDIFKEENKSIRHAPTEYPDPFNNTGICEEFLVARRTEAVRPIP